MAGQAVQWRVFAITHRSQTAKNRATPSHGPASGVPSRPLWRALFGFVRLVPDQNGSEITSAACASFPLLFLPWRLGGRLLAVAFYLRPTRITSTPGTARRGRSRCRRQDGQRVSLGDVRRSRPWTWRASGAGRSTPRANVANSGRCKMLAIIDAGYDGTPSARSRPLSAPATVPGEQRSERLAQRPPGRNRFGVLLDQEQRLAQHVPPPRGDDAPRHPGRGDRPFARQPRREPGHRRALGSSASRYHSECSRPSAAKWTHSTLASPSGNSPGALAGKSAVHPDRSFYPHKSRGRVRGFLS